MKKKQVKKDVHEKKVASDVKPFAKKEYKDPKICK